MKGIESILAEIERLPHEELEIVLKKIVHRLNETKRIKSILSEYSGFGKGIWDMDAQVYVNKLREGDRL